MTTMSLESIEQLNETTFTFWFKPSTPIDYTAGQFVEIFLPHKPDGRGVRRWFTLSSSPSERHIAITTRKVTRQSSFKKQLFALNPGDTAEVSQAMGDFVLPMQKSIPIIFLVRGIGVTPVRSILECMQDTKEERQISVIYSTRTTGDAIFTDLINSAATNVDVMELESFIDIDLPIAKTLEHVKKAPTSRIYVSGPEQFVEKVYERLLTEKIKDSSIVTDYFHGYET